MLLIFSLGQQIGGANANIERGASVSREVASTDDKNIYIRVHPEKELDTKGIRNIVESKIVRLSIAFYRFHMLTYNTCQRK
jgi:hypothetical protein